MTTASNNTTLASDVAVLATLRALTPEPPGSLADALDMADRQATRLQTLLACRSQQVSITPTSLIPNVDIEPVDNMPVPGTSFWTKGRWHIHFRASDPVDSQTFTVLHQLKHIIDHPLRRRTATLTNADWEIVADRFAAQVRVHMSKPIRLGGAR